jgi:hypothetical protein
MIDPSSAILGKGLLGMMETLKALSGKLFRKELVRESHA